MQKKVKKDLKTTRCEQMGVYVFSAKHLGEVVRAPLGQCRLLWGDTVPDGPPRAERVGQRAHDPSRALGG